jgi:hypothetical protein
MRSSTSADDVDQLQLRAGGGEKDAPQWCASCVVATGTRRDPSLMAAMPHIATTIPIATANPVRERFGASIGGTAAV